MEHPEPVTVAAKFKEAWRCETCRRYRQGAVLLAVLLAMSWISW